MRARAYHSSVRAGPLFILGAMLTLTKALFDQIVEHSRQDHPDEACGVIAGPAGSGRPERFIPMLNAARSPTFYEFDSADLLKLYREMDDRDEEPVIIYHSHTATEAYPRAPTSPTRTSPAPTMSWSPPPTPTMPGPSSSARTGSWTARSPRKKSRSWRPTPEVVPPGVHQSSA